MSTKKTNAAAQPQNFTPFPLVDTESITPHPENPNIHPAGQIEALCEVIIENGWRSPVVVSRRSGLLIKGHGRLLAAKRLGCRVPLEYQDYPDEATEMRDLVADNKIAELSMLSDQKIAEIRARFKEVAKGWGDVTTGGELMSRQFGELEAKKPKEMKFPILILQSQREYDLFQALKARLATANTSDAKAFAAILDAANSNTPSTRPTRTNRKETTP